MAQFLNVESYTLDDRLYPLKLRHENAKQILYSISGPRKIDPVKNDLTQYRLSIPYTRGDKFNNVKKNNYQNDKHYGRLRSNYRPDDSLSFSQHLLRGGNTLSFDSNVYNHHNTTKYNKKKKNIIRYCK